MDKEKIKESWNYCLAQSIGVRKLASKNEAIRKDSLEKNIATKTALEVLKEQLNVLIEMLEKIDLEEELLLTCQEKAAVEYLIEVYENLIIVKEGEQLD
ncbi:hypothetical protein ZYGNAAKF_CDS0136 [Enterococcus phage VRE9_2]